MFLETDMLTEDDDFLLITSEPSFQPATSNNSLPSSMPTESKNSISPTTSPFNSNAPTFNFVNDTIAPSSSPTTFVTASDAPTSTASPTIVTTMNTSSPSFAPTLPPSYVPSNSPTVNNSSTPTSLSPSSFPTSTPSTEMPTTELPTVDPSFVAEYTSIPTVTVSNTSAIAAVSASGAPYFSNNNIIVVACLSMALFLCCLTAGLGFMRYRRSNLRSTRQSKSTGIDREGQSGTRLQFSEYLGEEEPDSDGAHSATQLMAGPHVATAVKGRAAKTRSGPTTTNPMGSSQQLGNEQEFYC